jgi:hypothetical protein
MPRLPPELLRMAVLMPSARAAEDGSVDADELPGDIHQRPTRIAGVDRGVGLDEAFIILDAHPATVRRADDPVRHTLAHPKGMTDGQDHIAHLHVPAVRQRDGGQVVGGDLDHRDVGLGIEANHFGIKVAPVR